MRTARYPLAERPDSGPAADRRTRGPGRVDINDAMLRLGPAKAAFIDTETTGLSLDAGTYTFLIGVGTFEEDAFVVRQFFMRNPAEEARPVPPGRGRCWQGCSGIVSFNGRGFDMPLDQHRLVPAAMPLPLISAPAF